MIGIDVAQYWGDDGSRPFTNVCVTDLHQSPFSSCNRCRSVRHRLYLAHYSGFPYSFISRNLPVCLRRSTGPTPIFASRSEADGIRTYSLFGSQVAVVRALQPPTLAFRSKVLVCSRSTWTMIPEIPVWRYCLTGWSMSHIGWGSRSCIQTYTILKTLLLQPHLF